MRPRLERSRSHVVGLLELRGEVGGAAVVDRFGDFGDAQRVAEEQLLGTLDARERGVAFHGEGFDGGKELAKVGVVVVELLRQFGGELEAGVVLFVVDAFDDQRLDSIDEPGLFGFHEGEAVALETLLERGKLVRLGRAFESDFPQLDTDRLETGFLGNASDGADAARAKPCA